MGLIWEIVKQVREQAAGLADWRLPVVRQWWSEREGLPLVQRWGEFVREVLLAGVGQRIVVFVDEIDSVLGLPFRADDFFAAIRELYNRRVDEPAYGRLTFALLGVCAPQDLIQDKRRTPFNIGEAIELAGFTFEEAQGLARGLPGGVEMLRSVLDWTGGQPFLTQRVCRLVGGDLGGSQSTPITDSVAAIVQSQIIERWEANDEQTHFRTIRDRVLSLETQQRREVLGIYQRVLHEETVCSEDTLDQIALRLTGLVVKWDGQLRGVNRIYPAVFDIDWVKGELARLCPFSEQMAAWMVDRDSSWLLQGQALAEALKWAKKQQRLGLEEYSFLQVSLNEIIKRTMKYIENQQNVHKKYQNSIKEYQDAVKKSQDANQNLIELLRARQKIWKECWVTRKK